MSAREMDLAQDNFPERGTIDYGDLGSHSVRFDMAHNISLPYHLRNDPGDSIVVDVVPVRAGADSGWVPELFYHLAPNPVFTPEMRTAGLPDRGSVPGRPAVDSMAMSTPTSGLLICRTRVSCSRGTFCTTTSAPRIGVHGNIQYSMLPADTTGFSDGFADPLGYDSAFTVHALPRIVSDGFGGYEQPEILFINDFGIHGGENKWYKAMGHVGLLVGEDYDVYHVNAPDIRGGERDRRPGQRPVAGRL